MKHRQSRKRRWAILGQGATEYGLILVLVAVVGVAALALLANVGVQPVWNKVETEMAKPSGS